MILKKWEGFALIKQTWDRVSQNSIGWEKQMPPAVECTRRLNVWERETDASSFGPAHTGQKANEIHYQYSMLAV